MISDMRLIIKSQKSVIEENNIDLIAIDDEIVLGDELEIELDDEDQDE
jgi:hypothetical protein